MEWTAERFIDRALTPRLSPPWWTYTQSESSIEKALDEELRGDIPGYLREDRRLYFFSSHALTRIDGRVGQLGIEEKCTDLAFGGLVDGAIHRGVVWVLGNAQNLAAPEAVSLYVVKPEAAPITDPSLSDPLLAVLGWLANQSIHVVFVNGTTGEAWRAEAETSDAALPAWLSRVARTHSLRLQLPTAQSVNQLESLKLDAMRPCYLLGGNVSCYEHTLANGTRLVYAEYARNHWQIIEIGLLLRASGYDAVKVVYTGSTSLQATGRGVEARVQADLRELGILLDWGVPI
jgi:hypothetical protein